MSKPLKELLEAYTFYAKPQQDNLDTLVQSDEMARRLRKLEMWSVHRRVTEYGEQELINEVRRILDGEE